MALDDSIELIPDYDRVPTTDEVMSSANELMDYSPEDDVAVLADQVEPYGKSWHFDFGAGEFMRYGAGPAEARELDSLKQWVLLCLEVDAGAHTIYDGFFGVEDLHAMIGQTYNPALTAEYERNVTRALLNHDRISEVDGFTFTHDPLSEVMHVQFFIRTDEDDTIQFQSVLNSAVGTS